MDKADVFFSSLFERVARDLPKCLIDEEKTKQTSNHLQPPYRGGEKKSRCDLIDFSVGGRLAVNYCFTGFGNS